MSLVSVELKRDQVSAALDPTLTTTTIAYVVTFDACAETNGVDALTATGIPGIGDALTGHADMFARAINLMSISACGKVCIVGVDYSTSRANMGSLYVEATSDIETEEWWLDAETGDLVANTAGEVLAAIPDRDIDRDVYVCERTEIRPFSGTNSIVWLRSNYSNRVNSVPYLGQPAGYWRLRISARRVYESGVWAWRVRYEIKGKEELWTLTIPNLGHKHVELSGAPGDMHMRWVNNKDDNGDQSPDPMMMKDDGTLATKEDGWYFREFNMYRLADFNQLGIPFV